MDSHHPSRGDAADPAHVAPARAAFGAVRQRGRLRPLPLRRAVRDRRLGRHVRCRRASDPADPGPFLADHHGRRDGPDPRDRRPPAGVPHAQLRARNRLLEDRGDPGRDRERVGAPGAAAPARMDGRDRVHARRGVAGGQRLSAHARGGAGDPAALMGVAAGGAFAIAAVGSAPRRSHSATGRRGIGRC